MKNKKQILLSQTKKAFEQSLVNELTCSICLDILDNPVMCSNCHNNFCDKCIQKWKDDYNFYCPFKCEYPKYYTNLALKNVITLISEFKNKIKANLNVDKNEDKKDYNNDKEQYKGKDEYTNDYQDKIIKKLMEEKNNLKIKVNILLEENQILLKEKKELQIYKEDAKRIINNLNEINKELKIKTKTKKKNTKTGVNLNG